MERAREFRGVYHVLHGVISPLNHIWDPDDIRVKELLDRVGQAAASGRSSWRPTPTPRARPRPCIFPDFCGPVGVKVTRLAYGIPVGSQLEYADEITLSRALEGAANSNF